MEPSESRSLMDAVQASLRVVAAWRSPLAWGVRLAATVTTAVVAVLVCAWMRNVIGGWEPSQTPIVAYTYQMTAMAGVGMTALAMVVSTAARLLGPVRDPVETLGPVHKARLRHEQALRRHAVIAASVDEAMASGEFEAGYEPTSPAARHMHDRRAGRRLRRGLWLAASGVRFAKRRLDRVQRRRTQRQAQHRERLDRVQAARARVEELRADRTARATDAVQVELGGISEPHQHPDRAVRSAAAADPDCPPETLEMLAVDRSPIVRAAVASNPNCPQRLLSCLVLDARASVASAAADNHRCRPGALDFAHRTIYGKSNAHLTGDSATPAPASD